MLESVCETVAMCSFVNIEFGPLSHAGGEPPESATLRSYRTYTAARWEMVKHSHSVSSAGECLSLLGVCTPSRPVRKSGKSVMMYCRSV